MAVTQTELKSSFLKDIVEEEKYTENIKSIQDWLTSQTQAATSVYRAQAQTASEQASYDISGAYANYLKQQRNIAAQGRLESGYKEEVGDVLQQQYQRAYSQARETQAQNVAGAQASYLKNVQAYQETASKAATSYYESALKEAELRANIYRAAEEYANLEGSQFDVYDIDPKTGRYTLTDWGYEQLSSALLGKEGGFKSYLEEEKLTDELEYYLADPTGTHKRLFGITETAYNPTSQESIGRKIRTEGYVESVTKPTVGLKGSDFSAVAGSKKTDAKLSDARTQLINYATSLGLTPAEYNKVLANYDRMSMKVNTKEGSKENLGPEEVEQHYTQYINELIALSEYKFGVTTTQPVIESTGPRSHRHK